MILTDNPITHWQFMQEGIGSWFIFLGALILMLAVWGKILGYMKGG